MIPQIRALRLADRALVSRVSQARAVRGDVFLKRYNSTVTGVAAVLQASESGPSPRPTLLSKEFSIEDRVALVSGGNGSIGLEMALALIEAGARAVYCVDLPQKPSEAWGKVRQYAKRMEGKISEGRLEYIQGDVTDQEHMWQIGEQIGDKEGRMDIGVAAAGVFKPSMEPLSYPGAVFKEVMNVNINGALFTAQAAGRQMARFGNGGSIIMVASAAGYIAIKNIQQVSYNASKAAVLQMTRSLACELAPQGIRVNALSPGWMRTNMTAAAIDDSPEYFNDMIPMGRVGLPHELRGATAWLASDSSSFCTGTSILVDGALCAQ